MIIVDIMTWFSSQLNEVAGGNQFLSGAIAAWFLAVVSYLCRGVPRGIFNMAKRHFTTSMTLNNGTMDDMIMMSHVVSWIRPKLRESLSRTISVNLDWRKGFDSSDWASVGIGYGVHFFFHERRLYWLHKQKLESSGSERQKEEIMIGTIGRSHQPFIDMIEESKPKPDNSKSSVYTLNMEGIWNQNRDVPKRPLSSVALDDELKQDLVSQIEHFKENREWFYQRALAYKLTYILHGIPGSGKTSLIKAIASEFNMNLCVININNMSDGKLDQAFTNVPDNSVILIEDFDSSPITKDRKVSVGGGGDEEAVSFLSLTGFLNALDGVVPLDNCLVFMTTNHLDNVDPAIYRKGRVDHVIEMNELNPCVVRDHVQFLYPDADLSGYEFNSCMGCVLNESLLYGKEDVTRFMNSMIENGAAKHIETRELMRSTA